MGCGVSDCRVPLRADGGVLGGLAGGGQRCGALAPGGAGDEVQRAPGGQRRQRHHLCHRRHRAGPGRAVGHGALQCDAAQAVPLCYDELRHDGLRGLAVDAHLRERP